MDLSKFGFKKATERPAYLRILVFGESFTGKSSFALSAPDPVVFDLEGSTLHLAQYGAKDNATGEILDWVNTDFFVSDVVKPYEIVKTIHDWRKDNIYKDAPFKTIVIDPITLLWEQIQRDYAEKTGRVDKHLRSEDAMFDRDIYRFDEWGKMKRPIREVLAWLNEAPVHKIYTAHSGSKFEEQIVNGRKQIVESGHIPSAEKGVIYHVDIVIEMLAADDPRNTYGKIGVGMIQKDRTQTFRLGELIENPRFELWEGAKVVELETTVKVHRKAPEGKFDMILQHPEVKEYQEKLGLSDEQLLKGVKKYKTLDATIAALKSKVEEEF